MQIEFDKSFLKCIEKLHDSKIKKRTEEIILELEKANSLVELKNIKKLIGFRNYYRIRLGDYRLGFELEDSRTVRFIIIAHRKDIYKRFP